MRFARFKGLRYALFLGSYFFAQCVVWNFLVQLYMSFGFSDYQIGIVTMLTALCTAVFQPLWGMLCDKLQRLRAPYILSMCIGMGASVLMYIGGGRFEITLPAAMLMGLSMPTMMSVIDGWFARLANEDRSISYQSIRASGSLAAALGAVMAAPFFATYGMWTLTPIFIVLAILSIGLSFIVPEPQKMEKKVDEKKAGKKTAGLFKELLTFRFIMLMLASFLIYTGSAGVRTFLPVKAAELGAGSTQYAWIVFVMGLSEIPVLLFYRKLLKGRFSPFGMLLAAYLLAIFKELGTAFSPNLIVLGGVMVISSMSVGLSIAALVDYILDCVGPRVLVSAKSVLSGVTMGVSTTIGNFISGVLSDRFGVTSMLMMTACITAAGCAVLFAGQMYYKRVLLPRNEAKAALKCCVKTEKQLT